MFQKMYLNLGVAITEGEAEKLIAAYCGVDVSEVDACLGLNAIHAPKHDLTGEPFFVSVRSDIFFEEFSQNVHGEIYARKDFPLWNEGDIA